MSDPFLGQIIMAGYTFAPVGWAKCDGQLLATGDYSSLFSLIGTIYGGDGFSTFALPDMRGRLPMHQGTGAGLTPRTIGAKSGAEQITLSANNLPPHSHPLGAGATVNVPSTSGVGNQTSPNGNVPATANDGESNYSNTATPNGSVGGSISGATAINSTSNAAVNNLPPFLVVNFTIALTGVFPSPS